MLASTLNVLKNTPKSTRTKIAALVLSAAGLGGIASHEGGFRLEAYTPIKGDTATISAGNTFYEDGTPVKLGDKITKDRAVVLFQNTTNAFEQKIKQCIKVPLYQYEYDAFVSLTFNIGSGAFCGSTLVKRLNNFDYAGACQEILRWDKFGSPPKPLKGLTNRRQQEYRQCLGT